MPSAANIVLADSVPANHTFNPVEVDPADSLFLVRDISITSAGNESLRLNFSRATSGRPTNRVQVRLDIPYEQTVDGVTTVYDIFRFAGTFTLPETMTSLNRANAMALVQNALANSVVAGYVEDLEPVWG